MTHFAFREHLNTASDGAERPDSAENGWHCRSEAAQNVETPAPIGEMVVSVGAMAGLATLNIVAVEAMESRCIGVEGIDYPPTPLFRVETRGEGVL